MPLAVSIVYALSHQCTYATGGGVTGTHLEVTVLLYIIFLTAVDLEWASKTGLGDDAMIVQTLHE